MTAAPIGSEWGSFLRYGAGSKGDKRPKILGTGSLPRWCVTLDFCLVGSDDVYCNPAARRTSARAFAKSAVNAASCSRTLSTTEAAMRPPSTSVG
jgi:hypothetical protein